MFIAVMWWLAQVVGMGLIAYLILWAIDFSGLPAPFRAVARVGVGLVAVIFLICMVLRLFVILGHPLVGP